MVSGPIRRSKTFFMGGYQGFYENIPFPVTRTIPTDLQLQGDFSQTTTANGTPIVIYDPATTRSNGAGGFIRDQIQCNGRLERDLPGSVPSRLEGAAAILPAPERRAEQPLGQRQFRQLAERRTLPLQLLSDADRPQLQHPAPAVVHQHRELGHRVPQRERPARAGHPERQLADAPQPLPRVGGRQHHAERRPRSGTRGCRSTGSRSPTTRSTETSIRSSPSRGRSS